MAGEPPLLVEVAVAHPLPRPLVYSVPDSLRSFARRGLRARVPLGRRTSTGVIWRLGVEAPPEVETRPLLQVLDLEPPLPADLLELAQFTSEYYFAPLGEVLASMLPQQLPAWGDRRVWLTPGGALAEPRNPLEARLRELLLEQGKLPLARIRELLPAPELAASVAGLEREGRLASDATENRGSRYRAAFELAPLEGDEQRRRCGRSPAGAAAVDFLRSAGRPATSGELHEAGASDAVLRRLVARGVLRRFLQPERRSLDRHLLGRDPDAGPIRLRTDQTVAVEELLAALSSGKFLRFLLEGVTGAGKTEVYLRAARAALEAGRGAILMVPEIALVPALAREATERFGTSLAVLHSGLGSGERHHEWERIRRGEARLVVGPRSAVFAPVADLGLIVVDEEQDLAYKQEGSPRYHGRDLALVRCQRASAVALLVSATPSLESRRAVDLGRFRRLRLTERTGSGRLPEGILVDLRAEPRPARPGEVPLSARLVEEIERVRAEGDQAILLRNRRGYAPVLLCRACGEDFRCPDCGLPRTLHRRDRRLVCHWCGGQLPAPRICPACQSEALDPIGAGTERIEEEIRERFPGLAVDVLDRDAARRVGGAAAILERFRRRDTQLLIGTQMLSKGHHFPAVALTAVVSADAYLSFPDFRAVEKTYALLTQIAGRSGRGERPGRVVIQTWHPRHYAIQAALTHDDEAFVTQEMHFRQVFGYPPFTRMVQLLASDRDRERARARLSDIAARLSRHPAARSLRVTGPAPAPLERLRGEWRFQLLVRGERGEAVRRAVGAALGDRSAAQVVVDVDPYQLL